jgi:glycosyltransferase involved in cell wall biosynthesis
MINICYVISDIAKSFSLEWTIANINSSKFNLHVVLINNNDTEFERFICKQGIPVYRIAYASKADMPQTIYKIWKYLKKEKIQIIHCHLFEASIAGLIAAKLAGVSKRIYTRHNSTINLDYYPKAVKYDRLINYLSTDIIAISKVVKDVLRLRENVPEHKIKIVYHGFDFEAMDKLANEHKAEMAEKYKLTGNKYPVIGVVSRFIEYKGVEFIIPAFKRLLGDYPNAHLVFCNAVGPNSSTIKEILNDIPSANYTIIEFEENIFSMYKLFNIFVHVPVYAESEAFGLSCIEAWALEVPSVFTNAGIVNEMGIDKVNCLIVDFKSEESIYKAMLKIMEEPELKEKIIRNGKMVARIGQFDIAEMTKKLEQIYLS